MSKLISIPLVLLILLSGLTVNVATHYCGGNAVASRISFSGKFASCGMETQSANSPCRTIHTKQCCENVISAYSFNNNYVPSVYSFDAPKLQITYSSDIPFEYSTFPGKIINVPEAVLRPPGNFHAALTVPEVLCIFRI